KKQQDEDLKKKFFKKKKNTYQHKQPSKKACRCWLCKAEGHYANECPEKGKRSTKALFEKYEQIVEVANMKGYEIAYSDDEDDDRSVYPAW
ncbi:hypothetical protein PSY31_22910, partial [Shigella flexneri]|nr:hypothetical protein [Shigella flexneri]